MSARSREMPLLEIEGNRFEGIVIEDLPEGSHNLQIQVGEGAVILEGVFVSDMRANQPPSAWARLTPLSGTTTRETDFVTIRMNLSELKPGIYTDHITVTSNGGTARIPVSLNVTGDPSPKILTVYRYTRGANDSSSRRSPKRRMRVISAPISARGLPSGSTARGRRGRSSCTGGTTPPSEIITTPRSEAGAARIWPAYLFEGPIGNIATIRLPGTRELYRWFNPATNQHFFTTDSAGEGQGKRGYRFEGIVGFVLR